MTTHTERDRRIFTFGVSMTAFGLALAVLVLLGSCKLPPIAVAYRGHGIFVTARDATGETIAKVGRAQMTQCEATHKADTPEGKTALLACLKKAREPVAVWVKHIKPAWTTTAAAWWLALEVTHAAKDRALDKKDKAVAMACAGLKSLAVSVEQYKEKIGGIASIILTAIAAGKVLVCP